MSNASRQCWTDISVHKNRFMSHGSYGWAIPHDQRENASAIKLHQGVFMTNVCASSLFETRKRWFEFDILKTKIHTYFYIKKLSLL